MKTIDTDLESQQEDHLNKINYVTEEILYLKLLKTHKTLMFFLLFLHIMILSFIFLRLYNSATIEQSTYLCQNATEIRNILYLLLNLPIVLFCY